MKKEMLDRIEVLSRGGVVFFASGWDAADEKSLPDFGEAPIPDDIIKKHADAYRIGSHLNTFRDGLRYFSPSENAEKEFFITVWKDQK